MLRKKQFTSKEHNIFGLFDDTKNAELPKT